MSLLYCDKCGEPWSSHENCDELPHGPSQSGSGDPDKGEPSLRVWIKRHAVAFWNFVAVDDYESAGKEAAEGARKCRRLAKQLKV